MSDAAATALFSIWANFRAGKLGRADGPGQLFPFNKTRTGTAVMTMAHKSWDVENKTRGTKKRERSGKRRRPEGERKEERTTFFVLGQSGS